MIRETAQQWAHKAPNEVRYSIHSWRTLNLDMVSLHLHHKNRNKTDRYMKFGLRKKSIHSRLPNLGDRKTNDRN